MAKWILEYIKKIIRHHEVGFISEIQNYFSICKCIRKHLNEFNKRQKSHCQLNLCRRELQQISTSAHDKSPNEPSNRNSIPQYNKGYIWQIHDQCFKHLDKNKVILKTYSSASSFWLSDYLNNFILGEGKHWKLLSIRERDLTQFQQLSNNLNRETWNPDNDGAMTGMPTPWQVLLTTAYLFLSAKLHV